jgi:N-acetylglucosaminyldiphosphoundecaprenol N-acetyl-beta-D-mannosaminyltransferase
MANILGINTGKNNKAEVLKLINIFYNDNQTHLIVTPNPEIILKAGKDEELFYILNHADISLADGFGLKIAALLSKQNINRFTGADLLPELLSEANQNQRRVLIINHQNGLSSNQDIQAYLHKNYPDITSLIMASLPKEKPEQNKLDKIKEFSPQLALNLFGSPYQEKYLHKLQSLDKQIAVAVGLGGAFDFLTNKAKRAPKLLRQLGLEWLWRLIMQPIKRVRRIWTATAVFMYKLIIWLYVLPYYYRSNVAILMFKQSQGGKEIFIVERTEDLRHWQIPQGGLDGENIIQGGSRELREESGTNNFKVAAAYKNLYRYQFPQEAGKYNNLDNSKHVGYRGQKQSLLITEFLGTDSEFKINYWDHSDWSWVKEEDFIKTIHPDRKAAGKIYLEKLKKLVNKIN